MEKTFNKFIANVKNKHVVIWGLGLNQGGLGAAKFFAEKGAKVVVVDLKNSKELANSLLELKKYPNIKYFLSRQDEKCFEGADMVIKNQGIPWDNPIVVKLLKKGVRIERDITLFFRFFKGKIVGITGSKGKTTTTNLVYEFLKASGKKVLLGGNLQVSLFSFFKENILNDRKKIAVLELSSFQLEDLVFVKKSPNIAVVTNIYRDHLNRYGTFSKYIGAKKLICDFQKKNDFLVLNYNNKKSWNFAKNSTAQKIWFSDKNISSEKGLYLKKEKVFLKEGKKNREVLGIKNPILLSKNNRENLAAALAVAVSVFHIKKLLLEKAINGFRGVPYRMEKVGEINNIEFINDTAATIPDAAIGNLKSFDKKVILISGGADKNLKFDRFAKIIGKKTKEIILLPGTATPLLIKLLNKYAPKVSIMQVNSMDKAVKTAYKKAVAGDIILLSPGCASFGLFKNEFDRGDQFNEAVKKLQARCK